MIIDYISQLNHMIPLCRKFESTIADFYFENGSVEESKTHCFVWSKPYQEYFEPIKACIELCRILKPLSIGSFDSSFFLAASHLDHPRNTTNLKDFTFNVRGLILGFQAMAEELSVFCSSFDEEEKIRMNEAIHNYFEKCNYSCVAMSVSAVESRLLKLMCLASPSSEQELEEKTLGQLINEYIQNKPKYKNIVPERHEPLLRLCNVYRVFSVHPKKQKISGNLAQSILNLALEFLTDQEMKPKVIEDKLVTSQNADKS